MYEVTKKGLRYTGDRSEEGAMGAGAVAAPRTVFLIAAISCYCSRAWIHSPRISRRPIALGSGSADADEPLVADDSGDDSSFGVSYIGGTRRTQIQMFN